jgi:hypothetical protein
MSQSVTLPARFAAGDTLDKTFSLADYPATAGYTLTFFLVSKTGQIRIDAQASGSNHHLVVLSGMSSDYVPDTYAWQAVVVKPGERVSIASGRIEITPNFATATAGLDTRTHARRTLEAIEATIEGRASSDILSYQIAGRELRKIPVTELLLLRDRYRADVRAEEAVERAASGGLPKNKIFVRL